MKVEGLPVPNSPYGLFGRKAALEEKEEEEEEEGALSNNDSDLVKVEVAVLGFPGAYEL